MKEVNGCLIRINQPKTGAHLLQGFIVDETCRIFGEVKLSALDLFSELPTSGTMISVSVMQRGASEREEVQRKERVCMCLVP